MNKLLLTAIILASVPCQHAAAARWYVNQNASGSQTGASWANAFVDVQPALNAASSGDSIWVAKGTYFPTEAADNISLNTRDKAIVLKAGVHVFGGFDGTESSFAARQTDSNSMHVTNATILTGDFGNPGDSTDNAYHVVIASGLSSFTMDGFTVRGGNADGTVLLARRGRAIFRHYAGGIYNDSSSGHYVNMVVEGNTANSFDDEQGGGGGMYNYRGLITVERSVFVHNHAVNCNGGAMKNRTCSAIITDVRFHENSALSDDEGGGGVDNKEQSNATFHNVVFSGNYTNASGGGMYNDKSNPQLINVLFVNNTADGSGGGMDTDNGSDASLTTVIFAGNTAGEDGGGLYGWKSNATLYDVRFEGNHAANNGGGMYYYNTCNPTVTNAIFAGNSAGNDYGGFGLERNSQAVLTNVLFHHNSAVNNGGALGCHDNNGTAATCILTNGTVVNNTAANGGGAYDAGTTSKIRNSIVAGNYPDDVDVNVALVSSARSVIVGSGTPVFIANGSVNPTGTPVAWPFFSDTTARNYRLVAGSPAIDAGDSSFFSATATPDLSAITTDLRKAMRMMGQNVDIGAYEFCTTTITPAGSVAATPGNTVAPGSTVIFTANVSNAGSNPLIEWYRNTAKVAGKTGTVFTAIAGTDFADGDSIYAMIRSSEPCTSLDSLVTNKLVMHVSTGVAAPGGGLNAGVFPNPASGCFNLSADFIMGRTYELTVTNLTGQKVMSQTFRADRPVLQVRLPATTQSGIYLLSLQEDGGPRQSLRLAIH